jgi:flagellar basal-body rod protein FlgF
MSYEMTRARGTSLAFKAPMNMGIYQSAASLSALERWQDSVTQNISSSQLTGYRKRTTEFSAQPAGQAQMITGQTSEDAGQPMMFPTAGNAVNFLPGDAQPTGRELDLSIQGQGFFEVQGPDGAKSYTRDGEFHVRPDNTITTAGGLDLLTESGSPLTALPTGGAIVVNTDGTVTQNGTSIGKLSIQQFSDNSQLSAGPSGTFSANGATPTPVAKPDVLQGYLEGSNVSPMHEMVDLITISRAYESNQKMITTVDQEMQKTLDALG